MKALKEHWSAKLESLNACADAVAYARTQPSFLKAWTACERGDWMLWYAGTVCGEPGSRARLKLVGAAADCAALALPIFEIYYPNDKRPRECIEVCRRYAKGEATFDQIKTAAGAAASADAARAAGAARAADAAGAARTGALKQCADIVRQHYPKPPKALK